MTGIDTRKKFIDKEKDRETGTANHGVRQYDPATGFTSPDAAWEKFASLSPYHYCRNNPMNRLDPNGLWDITVYVDDDRSKNKGMGTAVLTDRNGKTLYMWQVRAQGSSRDRFMKGKGDTPRGVYDIDDKLPWKKGGPREAYGPNYRLVLNALAGEIVETGRSDIRMHGGRQEDKKNGWEPNGKHLDELKPTQGCIRAYEDDMIKIKQITDQLEDDDPEEIPGTLTVTGDDITLDHPAVLNSVTASRTR